jgi:hypothetical protein
VLVETLSNTLRVGGVIASGVMDQSIRSVRPGISSAQLTGSVLVTAQLLGQARLAVAAAQVLDGSTMVQGIAEGVDSLSAYSSASEVSTVLPASSTDTLDNAVNLSTVASGSQLQEINSVVSADTAPANTAPLIGGVPAGTVVANNSYLFQPTASDADGNSLSFSILNKPVWASFNTTSGRLSGTPDDADTGMYSNIVIAASDGTDTASLAAFAIEVQPVPVVNTAPLIGGVPAGSVMATSNYVFQPTATDADGDTLSFSITNKPVWASFNAGNGVLSGAPSAGDVGNYNDIVISVSDGTDSASLAAFGIQVAPLPVVNSAPVIGGAPATAATANSAYLFRPLATDADGDTLGFSIANQPAWAAFNTSTGELAGTPLNADAGSYNNIVISVSDGVDSASLGPFSITVVNSAPVISGTPATAVIANSAYLFRPLATDADGDTLRFSITNQPVWAAFNASTGELAGTPLNADAGSYNNIMITVTDGIDSASLGPFSITVDVTTGSFTLSWTAPVTRADGSPLSLSDIDGYHIYYGSNSGNYTTTIDVTDGTATSATISNVPAGSYYVVMSTYDTSGLEGGLSGAVPKTAQ